MSELRMKTHTVHNVDYSDLEEFVTEQFGLEPTVTEYGSGYKHVEPAYSFVAIEECGNDCSFNFVVSGIISEYDRTDVEAWVESNGTEFIGNAQILDYLCWQGKIPAGNYNVSVSW